MKKPKIKKYKDYYLVFRDRKKAFKCFSEYAARLAYGALMIGYEKEIKRA